MRKTISILFVTVLALGSATAKPVPLTPQQADIVAQIRSQYPELMNDLTIVRDDVQEIPGALAYYIDSKIVMLPDVGTDVIELTYTIAHEVGHHIDGTRGLAEWSQHVPVGKDGNDETTANFFAVATAARLNIDREEIRKMTQARLNVFKGSTIAVSGWEDAARIEQVTLENIDFIYDNVQ